MWCCQQATTHAAVSLCKPALMTETNSRKENAELRFYYARRRSLQTKRIPFVYTTLPFHRPALRYHASLLSTTQLGWEPFIYAFPLRACPLNGSGPANLTSPYFAHFLVQRLSETVSRSEAGDMSPARAAGSLLY